MRNRINSPRFLSKTDVFVHKCTCWLYSCVKIMESGSDVTKAWAKYGHKDGVQQLKEDKELLLVLHFLSLMSLRRHRLQKERTKRGFLLISQDVYRRLNMLTVGLLDVCKRNTPKHTHPPTARGVYGLCWERRKKKTVKTWETLR